MYPSRRRSPKSRREPPPKQERDPRPGEDPKSKREPPHYEVAPRQIKGVKGGHGPPKYERDPRQVEDSTTVRDSRQNEYQMRIISMLNEVNSIKMLFNDAESRISKIDNTISQLPARIKSIRDMNYLMQINLEDEQLKAADMWATTGPYIKSDVNNNAASLRAEISSLERDISSRRSTSTYDVNALTQVSSRINTQRSLAYNFSSIVQSKLNPINSILTSIERGLEEAENTVKLTSSASFQWKEGETPVISLPAKEMNEDLNGILTLTNQRIIYENEKEVVLKKTLFFVTEKKIERQVSIEKPIGAVSRISKGQVGFFEGSGLFIEFKQDDTQLKLDTNDADADILIKYYNLITSGQIDDEIGKTKTEVEKPAETRIISCPYCGAPYTDEIYRGQTTVQCKYCNTRISIQ